MYGPADLAATDTVHFADLEAEVRDLIAGLTDSEPADFELTWRYKIGEVPSSAGRQGRLD